MSLYIKRTAEFTTEDMQGFSADDLICRGGWIETAENLSNEGYSTDEIASQLGCTTWAVGYLLSYWDTRQ